MRLVLVLLAVLGATPAYANAISFLGKLGERDIVVELTQPQDGAVAGRYSFLDTGGDIPLVPVSHADGLWVLQEEAICGDDDCNLGDSGEVISAPIAATWQLRFDNQTWLATGTRRAEAGKAKEQKVRLETIAWRPLDDEEEATAGSLHERTFRLSFADGGPLDWTTGPYEMLLLDVAMEEGPIETMAGAEYRYVTDPRSRFAFPRAVSLPGDESVTAINDILATQHGRMTLSAFDCLAYQYASYGVSSEYSIRGGHLGDYDSELVTLSYLSPRLVSWTQSGSLWCTGAHPYNHSDSYTYDLATGSPLDMSRIFSAWVPREWGAAPQDMVSAEVAAQAPNEYRWGPTPALIDFVRERLPTDILFDDAEMDETCFGEQAISERLDIRFAPGPSVVFTTSGFPHALSVCGTDLITVPLADLEAFLAPTATDYFSELVD
jgi:hypothetical protein